MRSGRKPRSEIAGATAAEQANVPAAPTGDEPDAQMSLESIDSQEEPAEILVRFPTDEPPPAPEPIGPDEAEASMPVEASAEAEDGATAAEDGATEAEDEAAGSAAQLQREPATPQLDGGLAEQVEAAPEDWAVVVSPSDAVPEVPLEPPVVPLEPAEVPLELVAAAPEPVAEAAEGPAARPTPYEPTQPDPAKETSLQVRLARIHLRTGSLSMARAEFEALAGRDLLDAPGLLDLAEVRWRTGDLQGAGTAAVSYLAANGGEALGFVIAAEAASFGGRHAEARRHMEQAHLRTLTTLDSYFAGIARRAPFDAAGWGSVALPEKGPAAVAPEPPAVAIAPFEPTIEPVAGPAIEPVHEPEVQPAAMEPEVESAVEPAVAATVESAVAEPAGTEPATAEPAAAAQPEAAATPEPVVALTTEAVAAMPEPAAVMPEPAAVMPEPAAVMTEPAAAEAPIRPAGGPATTEADIEIAEGAGRLQAGDALMAALHFGLALRISPDSATAVLAALGDRRDLALELVRGDALRLLGQESDAGQAYSSVASALSAARSAGQPAVEAMAGPPATQAAEGLPVSPEGATQPTPPDDAEKSEGASDEPPEPPRPISWSD